MKKKFLQFLIILAMSVQLLPDTFVRIIAEDTSIIHNEYVSMQTENAPDATLPEDAQLPEKQAKLHVIVSYKDEVKEQKYLLFNADHNPGKVMVSAVKDYEIESIQLDGQSYQGEAIAFDRESGFLSKEVIIKVTDAKKETDTDMNQTNEEVQSTPQTKEPKANTTLIEPYTPEGANFKIIRGSGLPTDPYVIDISETDTFLPGDPEVKDTGNVNNEYRYTYGFINRYQFVYEPVVRYNDIDKGQYSIYKLIRAFALNGLIEGQYYSIIDPFEGSSLVLPQKTEDEYGKNITCYFQYKAENNKIKNIHYNQPTLTDAIKLNVDFYLDGVKNPNMSLNYDVVAGQEVNIESLKLPSSVEFNKVAYRLKETNPTSTIRVTKERNLIKVYYESEKIKITFDANGGSFSFLGPTKKEYTIKKSTAFTEKISDPQKYFSRSEFLGWYTKDGLKFDNQLLFNQDTTFYAKWGETKADFYLIKKGQKKPINNAPDDSYKYFKYGEGYLVNVPSEVNDEAKVKEQIIQEPSKRTISDEEYCVVNGTTTPNCKGYDSDQYEPVWYRTINAAKNEWHVDGYVREKTKVNLEFNLMRAGNTDYDYFTNTDVEKGTKLSAWPEGTPSKIKIADTTYVFSGWYTDAKRTQKASLDTIYGEELVGKTVKLYAAYTPTSKLTLNVEGTNVTYDGKEHGLKSVTPSIKEGVTILYASEQPENEKSWTSKQPTSTNICNKIVYVKAVSDQYEDSDYVTTQLKISKRAITLTAASKEQVYNGKELSDATVSVSGKGLAENQTIETTVEGTITNVGKVDNIIENYQIYDVNHKAVNDNYDVEVKNGVLSIIEADSANNAITVENTDVNYDGSKKTVGNIVKKNPNATLWFSDNGKDHWTTTKPYFVNAGNYDVYVQARDLNYHDSEIVKANVTIRKLDLTLTANSLSKVYDGKPLNAQGYSMIGKLAPNQSMTVKVSGEVTNVQEKGISKVVEWDIQDANKESTKTNYNVKVQDGTLTILPASADNNKISVEKMEVTYDGKQHGIGKVTKEQSDSKIQYFVNDKWIDNAPTYTEAGTYIVKIKAVNPNYLDSSEVDAVVIIKERKLTLTAKSSSKIYDGTPLVAQGFDMDGSLAEKQGIEVLVSGSITNVEDKGVSSITSYKIKDANGKDVISNYDVSVKEGTLTIKKASASLNPLTVEDVDVLYDGYAHGLHVQAKQKDSTILYSKDGEHWQDKLTYLNICDKKIYVKAKNPNYLDTEKVQGTIKIAQRPITVSSASANKIFDGTPLTANTFIISEGTMARDQKVHANVTGSITKAGETANTISDVKVLDEALDVTDNYNVKVKTGLLKITKNATQNTIIVKDTNTTYDGKAHKITDVDKKIEDAKVLYSLDLSKNEWSKNSPEFVDAGQHVVYVKAEHEDYETSNIVTAFVNIAPRKIEFVAHSANKNYDGTSLTSSGYDVSTNGLVEGQKEYVYISGSQAIVGESDNSITSVIIKDGNEVTTENYEVTTKKGKLTVSPGLQENNTVRIENVEKTYDGKDFTINDGSKSVSSATIYYTTNKDDAASWSVNKPVFKDAMKYVVYAKAVDSNYQESKIVSATVTIKKRDIVVVATSKTKEYDGTPLTLNANEYSIKEGTSLAPEQRITDVKLTGSIVDFGEIDSRASDIVISDATDHVVTTNYNPQYEAGKLSITKANASLNTVSAKNTTDVYDGEEHTIADISISVDGAKVQYSLNDKDWTDTLPTFTEAGSHTVYLKSTHKNYEDSKTSTAIELITPRPITITASSKKAEYNAQVPLTLNEFVISEQGLVKNHQAVVSVVGSQSIVGTSSNRIESAYIKSADGKEDKTSNYEIQRKDGSLTVIKATGNQNKVITADETYIYDGEKHTIKNIETAKPDSTLLFYNEDKKEWSQDKPEFTEAKDYNIRIKASHHDYADTEEVSVKLHITKRPITLEVSDVTRVYDETPLTSNDFSITSKMKPVDNQQVQITTDGSITNVGEVDNKVVEYKVTDGKNNVTSNYEVETVPGKLSITPASQDKNTIAAKGVSVDYDGTSHTFATPITSVKNAVVWYSMDSKNWTTQQPSSIDVCNQIVYMKAVHPNYEESSILSVSLNVTAREITITPKNAHKVYDGTPLKASDYTIGGKGLVKEQSASVELLGEQVLAGKSDSSIGKVEILLNEKDVTYNYAISTEIGELYVEKASAEGNPISIEKTEIEYDGIGHALNNVSAKQSNSKIFYSTDNKNWSQDPIKRTNVGESEVYVKAVHANYADSFAKGIIKITEREITLKANSDNKMYDGKPLVNDGYVILKGSIAPNQKEEVIIEGNQTNVGTSKNKIASYKIFHGKEETTNNYKVDTVSGELSVVSADGNAVTFDNYADVYDGKAHGLKNIKATLNESTIQYSLDKEEWSETPYKYTIAGSYDVWVRAIKENYKPSAAIKGTITITPRSLNIKAVSDEKSYDGTPLTNDKYTTDGLVDKDVLQNVTVEGSITNAGSVDNIVSGGSIKNSNDEDVSTSYVLNHVKGTLTINKASSDKNKVVVQGTKTIYDGNNHGLTSVSSAVSEGTTFYYATSEDAKDKEWTTVAPQYVNAGTYPVFVKAVNPNYETAEPVASSIVIDKKVVTIQPIETSKVFGEKDKELIAQVTGMVQGDTIAYEVKRDAGENAGKYTIHIENVAISNNYTVDTKTSIFTIHKASAAGNRIFVKDVDKVYDGKKLKAQEAKALEGSKIEYSIDGGATWEETIPTRTNAGKTIVQVRATHPNFEESKATEEIVITKRIATIQANPAEKVYKESEPTLSAKLENVVSGEEAQFEYTVERKTGENVGTYDITVTNVKELGNYEIKTEGARFTINRASNDSNKVSAEDTKATYDGEDHTVGKVETTVDGAKVYYSLDGKEWSQEKPQFIEAGEYTVYVQAKDDNYEDSAVIESKVTIAKRDVTITASSSKRAYNKEALTSKEYSVSKDGLVKGQEIESIEVVGSITNVGTAKNIVKDARIVFGKEDTTNNYKIHYVEGLLEVVKASNDLNKVSVEDTKATYDGEDHTVGKVETTVDGAKVYYSLDGKKWSQEKPQFIEAGEYTIYVQAKDDNYEDSAVIESKVTIAKRDVTITASSSKRAYNKEALTSKKYSVSKDGLVKGQEIGFIEVVGSITNVGTAKNVVKDTRIVFGKEDTTNNYKIHYVEGLLEVVKASNDSNKVSVEDTKATYDGEDHTVGKVETTVEDSEVLYSKDGKEWSKEIPSFTEAGTYEVYLKAVNENYQDSEVFIGHVVIAKRAITITAQSASKVFDNVALVQPGYTLSENALVKEQTMEVEITGSQQTVGTSENKVSKVTVLAGTNDKTSNYEIKTVSGLLSVTAAITPVTPIPQLPLTPPVIPGVVVVNPEVQVPDNTTPKTDGKEVVKKKETPKATDKRSWALLNLLLAGGTLVLAIFLLVSKRKKEDEEEEEGKDHSIYTRKTWLKLTSSAIAILSIIVFCVTEDITLKMVFVDTWTLWMAVFFVVQVGTFYFGRKWKEEAAKQEEYIVE